jgi:hypothetical protein
VTRKSLTGFSVGLLGLLAVGCVSAQTGHQMRVLGLPADSIAGTLESVVLTADKLALSISDHVIRLEPWPEDVHLPVGQGDRAQVHNRLAIDGPERRIEIRRDGDLLVVIGDDSRAGRTVIGQWRLFPGQPIGPAPSGRTWVGVELGPDGVAVPPGSMVTLKGDAHRWRFYLIGATVPADADTTSTESAARRPAREDSDFIADWTLVRL